MWKISRWSRELGRGEIVPDQGAPLEFDASVATVDDFQIGEEVHVEVERGGAGWRVVRVWPDDPRFEPPGFSLPEKSASPLKPSLAARVSEELSRVAQREELAVVSFTPRALVLEGSDGYLDSPPSDTLIFLAVAYAEIEPCMELKSLRLSNDRERDYLASRLGSLSGEQVAVTLIDQADRFRFIVASGVERPSEA